MECSWILEHLYAYLDGELSPTDAAKFLAHIKTCPACRQALADATDVNDLILAHTAPVEPPADFAASVMSHIQQQEQSLAEVVPLSAKRPHWGRRLGGIAVAAALLLGVVVAEPWADQNPGLDIADVPDPIVTPQPPATEDPILPVEPTEPDVTAEPQPEQPPQGETPSGSQQPTTPSIRQPEAQPTRPTSPTRPTDNQVIVAQGEQPQNQPEPKQPQQPAGNQQPPEQPENPETPAGIASIDVEPVGPEQPAQPPVQPTGGQGEIALPKATYGTEGNGRFEVRLVAAHEGVNVFSPITNEKTRLVNYYIEVDGQTQLWQTDLDDSQEPVFLDVYNSMEEAAEVTPVPTSINPSAVSPDGSLMAALGGADQTPGLWLTSLTDSQEPQCLTESAGGSILSWAPNSGKLVFTDYLNCLYVAYPAENLVLPIATGDVSQVLWVDRGNTLLFVMCPEGGSNYGLYVAQLP